MSTTRADSAGEVGSSGPPPRPSAAVLTRHTADGDGAVLVADGPFPPDEAAPAYLHEVFEQRVDLGPARLAVDSAEDGPLTFAELDERANRLARRLLARGTGLGDRVALLFDRPVDAYTGMLAVSKIHATYVPLDVGFPADRIHYILDDADVHLMLSRTSAIDRVRGPQAIDGEVDVLLLDEEEAEIAALPEHRVAEPERRPTGSAVRDDDAVAYLIYTSGSTGRPKGVVVEQRSVASFVRTAAAVYGLRDDDRVYQGMTIAFDFSVEETWVPWAAGATLVPKPAGETLLGADLHSFLVGREVTALACVPTLLATLEEDLPRLRFLLVSGEACPQDLVERWYHPDRRFLNVYGPTEATVTATWTELAPERPVTIGVPLPTYAVVVLDPENGGRALPRGEIGEIGIAGIGLARGYVNNEEKTRAAFVPDFLGLDDVVPNPSGRIYRTGDLGRIDDRGEVEYHGRIDLQVKIRGYRIELTEIESVLLDTPGVAAAVVDTHQHEPGTTELVGYYTLRRDATTTDPAPIMERLRADLPPYMVPAFLERLDAIPMTSSDKADRAQLPPPSSRRSAPTGEHIEAETERERALASALAAALQVDTISVTADVFDELGATSLLVARFTAELRTLPDPISLSMKEVYQHPTVRELARVVSAPEAAAGSEDAPVIGGTPSPALPDGAPRRLAHLLTGAAHLLLILATTAAAGLVLSAGYTWTTASPTSPGLLVRGTVFATGVLTAASLLPIAVKWLLVGRWTPREIPLWGLAHLRFWIVRSVVGLSPLVLLTGTSLYTLYLRALGARIGRDVLVLSRTVPVATDLIAIGSGSVIRRGASLTGYRAVAGRLQLGPVTLGRDVLVGERAVLDIGVGMGDGSQLAPSSALWTGTVVPDGESWEGSPAAQARANRRLTEGRRRRPVRRLAFGAGLWVVTALLAAVFFTVPTWAISRLPGWIAVLTGSGWMPTWTAGWGPGWTGVALVSSAAIVSSAVLLCLRVAAMVAVPRLLAPLVRPGRTYPLYGLAHLAQIAITVASNSPSLMVLLGDSSFVTGYLRALGYHLHPVRQTGSNFGTQLTQDSPRMTRVGTGTMVSDGLTVANAEWSATSLRVSHVAVGENNFVGNDIVVGPGARVGDNVLLATKVLLPVDGPMRHDTGLLGSPAFPIPRSRPRDPAHAFLDDPAAVRRRMPAKNRHNASSIAAVLMARGLAAAVTTTVTGAGVVGLRALGAGAFGLAVGLPVAVVLGVLFAAVLERAASALARVRPHQSSIYEPTFWRHERLWKLYVGSILPGSPLRTVLVRLAGAQVGRRVLDDGAALPEKALVTIGDDAVLNRGSVIQCHSLEDGLFTRDATKIGHGSTLGVAAFVHLGVTVAPGTVLTADSFLMKGEQTTADSTWGGNPAAPMGAPPRRVR